MKRHTQPLLSIGLIIKNEMRCLERCMQSLAPLRAAIPCELVIADTGSTDGSRELASQYADLFFDYQWEDDFAAARNAVLARCSGTWFLSIDADEWLDTDIQELMDFLTHPGKFQIGVITIRNYRTMQLSDYEEQRVARVYLREGGQFYYPIHEVFVRPEMNTRDLEKTVLHHDGYAAANAADQMKAKHARNIAILEKKLAQNPNNLHTLVECIESSHTHGQAYQYIGKGLHIIEQTWPENEYAPNLLRHAVRIFAEDGRTEDALFWAEQGFEHYPHSILMQIDGAAGAMLACHKAERWEEGVEYGKRWCDAVAAYKKGIEDKEQLLYGSPYYVGGYPEAYMQYVQFLSLCRIPRSAEALEILQQIDLAMVAPYLEQICIVCLNMLSTECGFIDALKWLWIWVKKHPTDFTVEKFASLVALFFRQLEHRPPIWAELPDELGISVQILCTADPIILEALFQKIQMWCCVFPAVYLHLIQLRMPIPSRFFLRPGEELAKLARSLPETYQEFGRMLLNYASQETGDALPVELWKLNLIFSAFERKGWDEENIALELWDHFITLAKDYLNRVYQPPVMTEPDLMILPDVLRFACYSVRAQEALCEENRAKFVQLLKCGLNTAPQMKEIVLLLLEHLEKQLCQNVSPELLELADKVRTILAQYPPDDPAVAALKQSEVYQKVAYLIEGMEAPVFGGLPQ